MYFNTQLCTKVYFSKQHNCFIQNLNFIFCIMIHIVPGQLSLCDILKTYILYRAPFLPMQASMNSNVGQSTHFVQTKIAHPLLNGLL